MKLVYAYVPVKDSRNTWGCYTLDDGSTFVKFFKDEYDSDS